MKKLPLLMMAVATLALSCEAKKTPGVAENNSSATQMATADSSAQVTNSAAKPVQQVNEINSGQQTAGSGQKPALNPAHGEPYHRCDIEVGAPIDSPAPVQAPAPQVTQQAPAGNGFNTNPIQPAAAPSAPSVSSTSAAGPKPALNPPHGEPHHRCDLQVGAPLT